MRHWLFLAPLFFSVSSIRADVALLPSEVALARKGARHQLLVESREGDRWTGDVTARAKFASSNPAVASVNEKGVIEAVADGEATISAEIDGARVESKVKVAGTGAPFDWSFRNMIQPVLSKAGCNSGACHGAAAGKNGFKLSLRGYDNDWDHKALTRQAGARRLSLAEPEQSLALMKPAMLVPHEGGERFEEGSEPYRILLEWIRAGAPGPREDDPHVTHVEVIPPAVTLAAGAEQQILVRAHYDSGAYEDVTPWVKFGTTDESVAIVDENGKATVKGPGAAAITVWYASKVNSARVTVPREKPVEAQVFASARKNNFVDELILAQLESLRIAPAGEISDIEFIRRAALDATGALPSPEELFKFSMDSAPDKRAQLVERLLSGPAYADYWSYKWSDLLLLSSRNLPRREDLSAFYRFIRENVEANTPWDVFVRKIMTARGGTQSEGATNYFVMHQETVDLTETTSQAFLGMSITCARCHNHPLEKWTQDDYYGMANLLSRVKIKAGARGGETEIVANEFGDIIHPRIGRPVPPRPLDGEPIDIAETGDRRERLAEWLTSPENPYFTKAIVNRVWRNFMGRGLVEPEDDLRLTNPASNPALLDALAADLAANKYDLKHLMRTIMNSAAYQRSSEAADPDAPDEKYYSQYIVRRLPAEVILDAYSHVTGVPTGFDGYPEGFRALQLPDSQVGSYFLAAFGRPQRKQTCSCERSEDTSIQQTLHVANGETLNQKLRSEKSILTEMIEKNLADEEALDRIYVRALGRFPNPAEKTEALAILASIPREGDAAKKERREAYEDLTWAVLSGKEFLFNH